VYELCGINLGPGKEGLVKSRLMKRLRKLALPTFQDYLDFVEQDRSGRELTSMIDLITTNKTSFYRESEHFEYLRNQLLPSLTASQRKLRLWSAGCSSGEEPYTLAMVLKEEISRLDRWDVRILATDISTQILTRAKQGLYAEETLQDLPPSWQNKYFARTQNNTQGSFQVSESIRSMVRFAQLNLMKTWPMRGPFDVIFCRNVMIYFDKVTQHELVRRFWELLQPGGHLFVGHSESLTSSSTEFRYVQPAVYMK
jgi:chemotaxis protein methyltransferase CheR